MGGIKHARTCMVILQFSRQVVMLLGPVQVPLETLQSIPQAAIPLMHAMEFLTILQSNHQAVMKILHALVFLEIL